MAQSCKLSVNGTVTDKATGLPLPFVNIIIQETASGTTTDDYGKFQITNLCAREYHFILSHIGCESKRIHIELSNDTTFSIVMIHTSVNLMDVVITGTADENRNQPKITIDRQDIEDNTDKSLSGIIGNETGVHLIKSGSGIEKPVVHGLYGNRLVILNNGLEQSGQQWGNDHSPEIDPFSADKITLLKGVNALEYSGGNLGSTILVEPKKIDMDPHLHGQLNYIFETNGRGHNLNLRLEKFNEVFAWRVNGSVKKYGDRKTATYFLNNTGIEEANFSVQLEKSFSDKKFLDVYASSFNTRIGVLRGSHIGNLTDLEDAFIRDEPFYTEPNFSYSIDAPKQHVSHHLVKTKFKNYITDNQILEVILGVQLNNRKEFDVRRSGRTDIPALSLEQYSFNGHLSYSKELKKNWKLKLGNQNNITDNTNDPITGVLPLIPDYISFKSGLFSTLKKQLNKTAFDIGIRYDFEQQNVVTISNTTPREIIRYKNNFNNVGSVMGVKHPFSKTKTIRFNVGYASRNPATNELYSNGLHQGVSGIEEGDIDLNTEHSIKNTLEFNWSPTTKFSVNALAYYQWFDNYIFLNTTDEIRLTIRGAFPVFRYEQTNANIYGLDLSTQFTIKRIHLWFAQVEFY